MNILDDLLKQREELLKNYPSLKSLQDEINSMLSLTIDPVRRCEILSILMLDKFNQLNSELVKLSKLTKESLT